MAHAHRSPSDNTDETTRPPNGIARNLLALLWGLGGFTLLVVFGVLILREQPWNLTVKDALYWWVVAAMLVARTIEEVPASASDREEKRSALRVITLYAVKLVLLAGLAWVLVQSFRV